MKTKSLDFGKRFAVVCALVCFVAPAFAITPGNSWKDSYSVDGQCYCATTFDHAIGEIMVETPAGP